MKKFVCLLCCCALLALGLALPGAGRILPYAGRTDAPQAYAGVIRLWVWEELSFLSPWMSRCCQRFQRAFPGVYVYTKWVSEAEMRLCATGEIPSPDAVIYPSGMLASSQGLAEIRSSQVYSALNGQDHALPVAMGGYLFCESITDTDKNGRVGALVCPEDTQHISYSAALIALCARYTDQESVVVRPGEGMDLGLITPAPTVSSKAPEKTTCLPAALARREDACRMMAQGEAEAILISRRGYSALDALSQAGRSVEYAVRTPGAPFTDQVYWFSVPQSENEERMQAAKELGYFLLKEECQNCVDLGGVFSVVRMPQVYDGASGMTALEQALADSALLTAPPFGDGWRETAKNLWARCFSGEIDAWEALSRLEYALYGKKQH